MITAPYWSENKQAFGEVEYICPVCVHTVGKPHQECPEYGTMMSGSRYASVWIDEIEQCDMFPEEEENVASRLTTAFGRVCRMIEEAVRKRNRNAAEGSDGSAERSPVCSNPYTEHTSITERRI